MNVFDQVMITVAATYHSLSTLSTDPRNEGGDGLSPIADRAH